MNYIGQNHSSCGFGGITLYDVIENGTFQKISTVCHSNNQHEYKYRNMYSQKSVMLLVLYSYKRYSNFTFKLNVSVSECKTTVTNLCELKHDPLNLESNRMYFIKRQSCIVLQLDYGQGNMSSLRLNKSNPFRSNIQYYLIDDGVHLLRGK